jgi:2-furoate---CoA ligase
MNLGTVLRWTAERYPHRRAVGGAAPLTYAEWDDRTERQAHALHDLGAHEGSRAVFLTTGGEPLATLHLAAQKAGVTSIPLSTRLGADELAYCIADCAPSVVAVDELTHDVVVEALAHEETRPALVWAGRPQDAPASMATIEKVADEAPSSRVPVSPRADDPSVMLYTSGTTGRPKGVPRTHGAEQQAALAHLVQTGHVPGGATLGVMPLFHTMGLRTLLASVMSAGTWVPQARFDADEAIELIRDEHIEMLYLVPTIYWALLETGRLPDAGPVRSVAYAGAAMTPTLARRLVDAVAPERFVNHYGSTEIYTFTIGPDNVGKPGCAGRAGMFSRVRLVDPDPDATPDQVVAPGERGQVIASMDSPEAFAGYWKRPDADARAIRDGWYYTNDLAVADEDGDLWVSGRVDDMINSGGENIYPEEIEHALAACPDLAEVVVAGSPHERWGQAVTAYVVGRPGDSPRETLDRVRRFARDGAGLPSLKRPKRYVVVDSIPKSAVGKILRRRLTESELTVLSDSEAGASS